MLSVKDQITLELDFLNEQQLIQVADFTAFLKVRSKFQNSNSISNEMYSKYSNEDSILAEVGMNEYNESLLKEDIL